MSVAVSGAIPVTYYRKCNSELSAASGNSDGCSSCQGNDLPGGYAFGTGVNGIENRFALPGNPVGETAGFIHCPADVPTATLATPRGLSLVPAIDQKIQTVQDNDDPESLRQIMTDDGLVDIVPASPTSYEIRFFHAPDVQPDFDTNGYYQPYPAAVPFARYTIVNPAGNTSDVSRLQVVGGLLGASNTNDYTFAAGTNGYSWTLVRAGLLTETCTRENATNGTATVTRSRGPVGGAPLTVQRAVFTTVNGDLRIMNRTVDPDGAALTTTMIRGTNGYVDTVLFADGSWKRCTYDADLRTTSEIFPLLDVGTNAPASSCRIVQNNYNPVDACDSNSLVAWLSEPRTVTEITAGVVTRLTYYAFYFTAGGDKVKIVEQAASSNAAYGAAGNLRTKSTWYPTDANAPSSERIEQIMQADGRKRDYTYECGIYSTNGAPADWTFTSDATGTFVRVIATDSTANNPAGIAGKTTREVTIEDAFRRVLRQETWVCQGGAGYARVSWTANTLDDLGRVLSVRRSDGTQVDTTWGCCGKESETDAAGGTTIFSYDALKRPVMTVRESVSASGSWPDQSARYTLTTFDVLGRRLTETVTDGAALSLTTSNAFDNAGHLIRSVDAAGLVTTYDHNTANRIETLTLPGGATRVTSRFLDGRTASVTGTAGPAQYFTYGVNDDGTQWTQVNTATSNSPAWTRTTADLLGRTVREERPAAGGGTLATVQTYNILGQLAFSETLSSVASVISCLNRVIFAHDELGNQTASAQDLNLDGVLDYAGPDRVQGADSTYVQADGDWWRQTASWVCAATGSAVATTTSIQRVRLTGLGGSWSSNGVSGVLAAETVFLDIQGNRTSSRTVVDRANLLVYQLVDTPASSVEALDVTRNGLVQSRRTATGLNTTFTADGLGRQTGATDPRMGTSSVHFDSHGRVDYVQDTASFQTSYSYEPTTGRRIATQDQLGHTTYTAFDLQGRVATNWGATYPVAFAYSDYGRITSMWTWRDPSGAGDQTSWCYEEATGLLTNKLYADNNGTTYSYTPDGKLATRTWARGVVSTYSYTNNTDLVGIHYSDGTPDVGFTYDRLGRPTSITDATGTRTLTYDAYLRLATEDNNTAGIVRHYDSLGRETGFDLGAAYSVRYGFDAVGRFATLTSSVASASSAVQYSYIPDSDLIGSVSNTFGTLTVRSFEPHRPLITQVRNAVGSSRVISQYDYINDAAGRRTSIANSGEAFKTLTNTCDLAAFNAYTYNERGEVTGAARYWGTDTSDKSAPVSGQNYAYSFDSIGNRISAGEGDATRTANYTANVLNQYTQRQVPAATDIIGTANTNTTLTVNDKSVTRQGAYWHDVFPVANASAAAYSQAVIRAVYNPPGTNDPDVVTAATGRVFVAQTPELFSYDQDGNLLADGRFTYAWDAENRLTTVTTRTDLPSAVPRVKLEHAYDYMSRRFRTVISCWTNGAWQVSSTNLFAYDQWNIVQETRSTLLNGICMLSTNLYTWGLDLSGTLHGAGGIGGLVTSHYVEGGTSATPLVFCYDANGNVTELIDTDATLAAHYEYGPFGQTVVQTGPAAPNNPFRFSTKYHDPYCGLVNYGYRHYGPAAGRFLNHDPLEEWGGLNMFEFCGNDSAGSIDPQGGSPVVLAIVLVFVGYEFSVAPENEQQARDPAFAGGQGLERMFTTAGITGGLNLVGPRISSWFLRLVKRSPRTTPQITPSTVVECPSTTASAADGPLLPDEAWDARASRSVEPGTRSIQHARYNPDTGKLETSTVHYDEFGRQVRRTDYTDHGWSDPATPEFHTDPHVHLYEFGPGFESGWEIRINLGD